MRRLLGLLLLTGCFGAARAAHGFEKPHPLERVFAVTLASDEFADQISFSIEIERVDGRFVGRIAAPPIPMTAHSVRTGVGGLIAIDISVGREWLYLRGYPSGAGFAGTWTKGTIRGSFSASAGAASSSAVEPAPAREARLEVRLEGSLGGLDLPEGDLTLLVRVREDRIEALLDDGRTEAPIENLRLEGEDFEGEVTIGTLTFALAGALEEDGALTGTWSCPQGEGAWVARERPGSQSLRRLLGR